VWFSSADETAGKEYIRYCAMWARAFNVAAKELGIILLDKERDIKALSIEFANGSRINALSSSAKAFRSKGGKVVLDEFAWHDDPKAMWAAARPVITWGFPLRILSTHNGANSMFNTFVQRVKQGKLNWSLHTVTIQDAVAQGLLDKIMGRKTTKKERDDWIKEMHDDCTDEETWLQEYCCIPQDESAAFIPYDLYFQCQNDAPLWDSMQSATGDLYMGFDVGRKRDLSVVWIDEKLGDLLYTRAVIVLEKMRFRDQKEIVYDWLRHPRMRRACIDSSGLGMQIAEDAQIDFGKSRVECVTFTGPVKADIAFRMRSRMEDKRLVVPNDEASRESFHSIRKTTTIAGNVRLDAERTDTTGHGDHFWGAALAVHAAEDLASAPVRIITSGTREFARTLQRYL